MTSKRDQKKINFDNYADNYKDYITKSLGNIENNLDYFHIKKSEIFVGPHSKSCNFFS